MRRKRRAQIGGKPSKSDVSQRASEDLLTERKLRPNQADDSKAHLFDGQEIHRGKPDFQLCDITDPLIRKYIDDPNLRTDTCDVSQAEVSADF